MSTKRLISGTVLDNYSLAKGIYYLSIGGDIKGIDLKAGNFIHISCPGSNPVILRRPFSIFKAKDDNISIIYKVIGKGTENLSFLKKNDCVDFIIPCGNSFDLPPNNNNVVLIAGGLGIAPLGFLLNTFKDSNFTGNIYLYYGVTYEEERIPQSLLTLNGVKYFPHTDYKNGQFDKNLFEFYKENEIEDFLYTYICGPIEMLKVFSNYLIQKGKIVQLSLEVNMACGIGACLGCTIKALDGSLKHVCADGPIFYGDKVNFKSL